MRSKSTCEQSGFSEFFGIFAAVVGLRQDAPGLRKLQRSQIDAANAPCVNQRTRRALLTAIERI